MKTNKSLGQAGLTMVELVIALGLSVALALIVNSVIEYADRQTRIQSEDIMSLVSKYGAGRVLQRDIANSTPGFNYINMADDNQKPFFVFAMNEYCQDSPDSTASSCSRSFTMKIPQGGIRSLPFFLLVKKGIPSETLRFEINPLNDVFLGPNKSYGGVNARYLDPQLTISKSNLIHSPWIKDRLILLSTANQFYDCASLTQSLMASNSSQSCQVSCFPSGTCNYATTRALKVLGKVSLSEQDMKFSPISNQPNLIKSQYKLCSPDQNMNCHINQSFNLNSIPNASRNLFEKMPYVPGSDNLTTLTPVELVRYHLERPSANSPDDKIILMRSVATFNISGQLSFQTAHVLTNGIQSIVFSRKNISNPTIEYKITKVRFQKRI